MICVIDYGLGNIKSIINMLRRIGAKASITDSPEKAKHASKLILPGVGAFDPAMIALRKHGWHAMIKDLVLNRDIPILGICLGMQLFCQKSEEGNLNGLGLINATVQRFEFSNNEEMLKIPHMGWNDVRAVRNSPILAQPDQDERFYFVHSYYVVPNDKLLTVGVAHYGFEFTAAVQSGCIYGVQFHPEKSHTFGMALMKRFAALT